MEFLKSGKFMAILIAVLTVIAITIVGVGVATHTEPGLMDNRPGWRHSDFPLTVCVERDVGPVTDADTRIVQSTIDTINERLGFAAYGLGEASLCSPRSTARIPIAVMLGVPQEHAQEAGGSAEFVSGDHFCRVEVVNPGTDELEGLVLQHELGHCLGLAHDPGFAQSIMRPVQHPTHDGAFPPWIDDFDRNLIRRTYGHE